MDIDLLTGFEWDSGNARKNERHGVSQREAEEIFLNQPLIIAEDTKHSQKEARYHALGQSDEGRLLHATFTIRGDGTLIRIISIRAMHWKERNVYEQAAKASPTL